MSSSSSIRVIDFYLRTARTPEPLETDVIAAGDPKQEHERYLLLQDILGTAPQIKQAQEEGDTGVSDPALEKSKQERFVGKRGIQQAFGKVLRDLTEPYLPFDFYGEHPTASGMTEGFYQKAYGIVRRILPMRIVQRLNRANLMGYEVQPGDIKIDPEFVNKVITDMVVYANEHPEALQDALIRAYSKKGKEEGQVQVHDKRERAVLGVGQAVFTPKLDDASYINQKQTAEEAGTDFTARPGDVDTSVVNNVGGRDSVKWEWKGIDERGLLKFTLPELYGSRVFEMHVPQEIQSIRPGTYTFSIKGAGKRNVLVEFAEQREAIRGDSLKALEGTGLADDQMQHFINTFVTHYIHRMTAKPPEKLMEDLTGKLTVRGKDIGDAVELGEVAEEGRTEKVKGLGEGEKWKQKAQALYGKLLEEEHAKSDAVIDTWGKDIAQYFLRMNDREGEDLVRAIADRYPETSTKKTPSFQSVLETKPVVQVILRAIFSTPEISRRSVREGLPWMFFAISRIKEAMLKNPAVRSQIEALITHTTGKNLGEAPVVLGAPSTVTDEDINTFQNSITNATWTTVMNRMAKSLQEEILAMKAHPTIQSFFKRQEAFKNYMTAVKQDFKDDLALFVEHKKIDLASPDGKKMVAAYTRQWLKEKRVPRDFQEMFKEYTQKAPKKKAPAPEPPAPALQSEKLDQPAQVQPVAVPAPAPTQKTAMTLIHMLMPRVLKRSPR